MMEPSALPPSLAMILPMGFVENTDEVYAEVAGHLVIRPTNCADTGKVPAAVRLSSSRTV